MPALSPTMEAGNLAGWSVAVGDEISEGQALAQVETDKVSSPFPSYCLMRVVFATYNSGRDDHLIPCGIIFGWREREKERTRERERGDEGPSFLSITSETHMLQHSNIIPNRPSLTIGYRRF